MQTSGFKNLDYVTYFLILSKSQVGLYQIDFFGQIW